MSKQYILGVDTELEMANPARGSVHQDTLLLTTAISGSGKEYIWDCREQDPDPWFFEMLEDPAVTKVYHNASFDTKIFYHHFGVRSHNNWCSLLNERLLYLGDKTVRCGLGPTLKRRYGVELNKKLRRNLALGMVGEQEKEYALKDIRYLISLKEDQEAEINRLGLQNASRIENELSFYLGMMEYFGLPFDDTLYASYMEQMTELRSDAARVVWDLMDYSYSVDFLTGELSGGLNLGSPQKALLGLQRCGILVDDYSEETLVTYLHKVTVTDPKKRQIIQAILEYKKWNKALSWDYGKLVDAVSGTIHTSYNSLGAATCRTSSSEPNVQNIATEYYILAWNPETAQVEARPSGIDFRKLFVAPPGWKWIGADLSQIELRLYGGMAKVKAILDEYAKGKDADLHRQAAAMIYHKPSEEITDHERTAGKPVNFGCRTFGGGPQALIGAALGYGILLSYAEATKMRYDLLRGDPEGVVWGKMVTEQAKRDGYLVNLAGYRRLFPYPEQIRETVCRNTPVQGTAGAIIKEGIILFCQWIEAGLGFNKVKPLTSVHDELNSIALEEYAAETLAAKIDCMQDAGNRYMKGLGVECFAEGYVGTHWRK